MIAYSKEVGWIDLLFLLLNNNLRMRFINHCIMTFAFASALASALYVELRKMHLYLVSCHD